ncbi:PAS-domain containing protein [Aquabacterium sp.]|uniref:PAS-domain containing protein n=1 Tax=Aquabacterium sp. TaxID=1872578 RepID=UPI002BDC110D|nr:PAS-domain containing protein [Aquabacterium sp.]HSW07540.1 PAS-domain containing protein [Aquabacterium sp.]
MDASHDSPKTADEAQHGNRLLRLAFDHAGEGIGVFDAALRLLAWNERFVSTVGLEQAALRAGMPLHALLLGLAEAGEYGAVEPRAEAARRTTQLSDPQGPALIQHLRPNGRSIELRRSPTPEGGFVLLCADITERKAAEAAAADNQRMLSLLLQRTQQGFWFIDNALLTTDANPAMCRMLGLTLEQLIGRHIFDFVDEANETIFRHQVVLRAQGRAEGYEIALTRADGGTVHCFNNATPIFDAASRKIGAVGMFSDISEQKRAEQQIRHTSELLAEKTRVLEATLDSLSQGVLSLDAQGRTNTFNLRFVELLQIPESLMQTRPTLETLTRYQLEHGHFGPDLNRVSDSGRPGLSRYLAGEGSSLASRYQRTRADGTVLDVQTHVAADGSVVRTYTDVTASVQTQQALIAAKVEAERASRAKSEFLSRMSHELRTPLNAVLGFGQLLEADALDPLSATQRARVQELLRGGRHLLSLINEVLDLASIEAGSLHLHLVPVDLGAVVGDCLRLVQPMAGERRITLEVLPAAEDARHVLADATRLKQVLLNLLSNAIKYNREGGSVRLGWRVDAADAADRSVRIEVRDDGPGLSSTQQERLFQAFDRLDAERSAVEGTGIGLALSKWLVELMRGEIGVCSAPGAGSTFWVRLACCSAADAPRLLLMPAGPMAALAAAAPMPAESMPVASAQRRTVLYIEDNAVNQLLMEGMLAHRPGLRLLIAGLPAVGLTMAAQARPDLILLDIQLPEIDGFEVLRRLREQPATRDIPVVAVSANAMPTDIEAAEQAGFIDYVVKPLDMKRLLGVVDRVLGLPG